MRKLPKETCADWPTIAHVPTTLIVILSCSAAWRNPTLFGSRPPSTIFSARNPRKKVWGKTKPSMLETILGKPDYWWETDHWWLQEYGWSLNYWDGPEPVANQGMKRLSQWWGSTTMLDICGRVDLISLPEEGLWSITCLNNLSITDCHGLFVSSRNLGFSDNEDDDDTVKKFQGLRSFCTIRGNCFNSRVICLPREIQHVTSLETLSVIVV